jgi:hypothetical protein
VAQIDGMAARPELPDAVTATAVSRAPVLPARAARPGPPSGAIDRVAVPRPEIAAAAPIPRPSAPQPAPARAARPVALAQQDGVPARRPGLRGVALSELLPCVSDARELALKQKTVAAARNASLCESPAGRFHFVETKNVNAFLMSIEQAPGRRSGDRCEELTLALECLASPPPRSSR